MDTRQSVHFEPAPGDAVYPTCWPELTSYRVGAVSTSRTLAAFRQFVLKARGVEEPTEALPDEWDHAAESNAYLLSDTAGLVGTIRGTLNFARDRWRETPGCAYFQEELTSRFRSERCVEADRLLTVPGDPAEGGRRLFALMQNITAMADEHQCGFILAAARMDHTRFFLGMGFVEVTEARIFPSRPLPMVLLALDWQKKRNDLQRHKLYRYLFSARNFGALADPGI